MTRKILACLLLLLPAACGGIIAKRDTAQIYVLQAPAAPTPAEFGDRATLQVALPEVAPGLETDKIGFIREGGRLDYVADARWPEPLQDMLQALIIDAFEKSGRFAAAGSDTAALNADYIVQCEAPEFNLIAASGTHVRIRLRLRLLDAADHRLIKSVNFEQELPAASGMTGAVAAFNQSLANGFSNIIIPALTDLEPTEDEPRHSNHRSSARRP